MADKEPNNADEKDPMMGTKDRDQENEGGDKNKK